MTNDEQMLLLQQIDDLIAAPLAAMARATVDLERLRAELTAELDAHRSRNLTDRPDGGTSLPPLGAPDRRRRFEPSGDPIGINRQMFRS